MNDGNELYRKVIDNLNIGVGISEKQGNLIYTNKAYANIYGSTTHELIGTSFLSLLPQKSHPLAQSIYDRLLTTFTDDSLEVSITSPNGILRTILIYFKPLSINDSSSLVLTAITDISEKKHFECTVKQNTSELQLILNSITDLVTYKDLDGNIIRTNKAVETVLGLPTKGIIGNSSTSFMKSREAAFIQEQDKKVITTQKPQQFDTIKIDKNQYQNLKRDTYFSVKKIPTFSNNKINGILTVSRDVTELAQLQKELEQTNQTLNDFASSVTHDLKSPLASIRGLIQIAMDTDDIAEIRELLMLKEEKIKSLEGFIFDMLNYARNQSSEVFPTKVFAKNLIHKIKLQFEGLNSKIAWQESISQSDTFYTDIFRLEVILNNIIGNAYKYHNLHQSNPFVSIKIDTNKDFFNIEVADNGAGIKKEYQPKIFDMFYRASENSNGSGLGLHIVKQVVEKLGGSIRFHSEYTKGTTFYITLPNLELEKKTL